MRTQDEQMMWRCLQLAQNGLGSTYPNPLVGCVITHQGEIIGEGWHKKAGEPHAEVNAIQSVKDKSLLAESILYVNLEPCHHYGKTPPCTLAITQHNIPHVVIGVSDSAAHVNGKGIEHLRAQGVKVTLGVLEKEAQEINRRFFTFQNKKRPYIILKWAQTQNGFFAPEDDQQKWITHTFSKQLVHKWRTEEEAILVGFNTAKIDNPQLTARLWNGRSPLRIVLDRNLDLNPNLKLFSPPERTLIFNQKKNEVIDHLEYISLNDSTSETEQILTALYDRNIQSVIVEGGAQTLKSFIDKNLWDEARILTGNCEWETGIPAPTLLGKKTQEWKIADDKVEIYRNL